MVASKKFRSYAIQSVRRVCAQLDKHGETLMLLREQYGEDYPQISEPLKSCAVALALVIESLQQVEQAM